MSGWLRCCVVLTVCCLGSCSVGRAVVGEHGGGFGLPTCDPAPECEPLEIAAPEGVPEDDGTVDFSQCESAATLCPGAATMPAGSTAARCTDLDAGWVRSFEAADALHELRCSGLRLSHKAASGAHPIARVELDVWDRAQIEVESDAPVTLELAGGRVARVALALRGPITLRIMDTEHLQDLRVTSDGTAQIELTRVRGASVAISAPQGSVWVRRSSLDRVRLAARRIDLESSYVSDAAFRAEWLHAVDATLLRVRSEVERSVLSACDVSMATFSACQAWTAVQGRLSDVQLAACAEEVSVYGSAVVRGQFEGDLLLDGATLSAVVLGLGEVGAITTWDTQLTSATFCADQQSLSLGGFSAVRCARCDRRPGVALQACLLEGSETQVESSESCEMLDMLAQCGEAQPERMRPPRL